MNGSRTGGIGFFGLLAVLFIGLKLGGIIEWSWIWVLSPVWASWILFFIIVCIMVYAENNL
jgi:hypothetical protein